MDANFNSLPFPMQLMQLRQMQQQQAARRQAGQVLYDQFPAAGPGEMGEPAGIPQPPPGSPAGGPQAPPPGAMSPGGGNPMAAGGASIMARPQPQGGGMPPPPMMQAGAPPPMQQPGAMMTTGQPPIEPFKAMPSAPPPSAPGQVPPPPAAAAPREPNSLPLKNIIMGLRSSGVKPDQVMNMLDVLTPVMNSQNKMELAQAKLENQALQAASLAYARVTQAGAAQTRATTGVSAEERRTTQGNENIQIKRDKEARLKAQATSAFGGADGLKSTEYVYPKGANGQPDQTQPPIGVRAISKTGKIINLDAEGHQVPTLAGATAKEGKASQVNVRDTVRGNLVEGSALNAINRLAEIEKMHPNGTVSLLFGKSPGDSILMGGAHAAVRGTQDKNQQDIDAKWASFIDEVIPVFTGGLRGSDAFRKFLIEQAPQPNAKPEAIKEKIRLFRENIKGTQSAFANKFKTDPAMWGQGVKPEEVQGGGGGAGAAPAGIPQGAKLIGKTPEGKDVWQSPDGKNWVP